MGEGHDVHRAAAYLSLLGPFNLHVDGRAISLQDASAKVLAAVALGRRPVSRQVLAEMLWPDRGADRARANLRSVIWRFPSLARATLIEDRDSLRLAVNVVVDVDVLVARSRELLRTAARHAGGTPEAVAGVTHDDLLGDLLPMWDDDWVLLDRTRLRQLRLHALDALVALLIREGRLGEAVDAASAALRDEPLRESAVIGLVSAHLAGGNVADAWRVFDNYRDDLVREMGIAPSARLRGLLAPAVPATAGSQDKEQEMPTTTVR